MGGRVDLQGKREDPSRPKGKRESGRADHVSSSFPPYYQAARTHDRTETETNFPVGKLGIFQGLSQRISKVGGGETNREIDFGFGSVVRARGLVVRWE